MRPSELPLNVRLDEVEKIMNIATLIIIEFSIGYLSTSLINIIHTSIFVKQMSNNTR